MGCVGYNLGARMVFTVLVGHAIVKHLSGAIMGQDSFIPVANRIRSLPVSRQSGSYLASRSNQDAKWITSTESVFFVQVDYLRVAR
jgi:hypothetical protein